jgi:hypothetical protein
VARTGLLEVLVEQPSQPLDGNSDIRFLSNEIFIENGRFHGKQIVNALKS